MVVWSLILILASWLSWIEESEFYLKSFPNLSFSESVSFSYAFTIVLSATENWALVRRVSKSQNTSDLRFSSSFLTSLPCIAFFLPYCPCWDFFPVRYWIRSDENEHPCLVSACRMKAPFPVKNDEVEASVTALFQLEWTLNFVECLYVLGNVIMWFFSFRFSLWLFHKVAFKYWTGLAFHMKLLCVTAFVLLDVFVA